MGIINVTPDSFADGGLRLDPARAIEDGVAMAAAGADLLDIGGESTRPGAEPLPLEEELQRVLPVIRGLRPRVTIPLSIDTYKAGVARAAVEAGASIVNDISGLRYDPALSEEVARSGAAIVLMHTRGRSRDMYREARYASVADEVRAELADSLARATAAGIPLERTIVDPGLGFAKRAEHSYAALVGLDRIASLARPVLVGPSRKSFLQAAVGERPPIERVWATAGAVAASVLLGAHIVRVHDVAEMVQVVRVADAIRNRGAGL